MLVPCNSASTVSHRPSNSSPQTPLGPLLAPGVQVADGCGRTRKLLGFARIRLEIENGSTRWAYSYIRSKSLSMYSQRWFVPLKNFLPAGSFA